MDEAATVGDLFDRACRLNEDRPFLMEESRRLTGRQASDARNHAQSRLTDHGLRAGDLVMFVCGPSVSHAVAFCAAQRAGAVCCCLHVNEVDARIRDIVASVSPAVVVCDAAQFARIKGVLDALEGDVPVVDLDDLTTGEDEVAAMPCAPRKPGDRAVILLSSGTTGTPKQVVHTQETVLATAQMAGPIYGAQGPEDGVVIPMAPSFAAWLHTVLPFIAIGGRLYFERKFDAERYARTIDREGLTVAALVPTLWRSAIPAMAAAPAPSLRVAMFSGEPGTPGLVASLLEIAPEIRSVYLSSEGGCACGIVADETLLSQPGKAKAAGRPVAGGSVCVIDSEVDAVQPVPTGTIGEIAIRGPSLSPGYVGDPQRTARSFVDGWWRTGDLGVLDESGVLYHKGRLDNCINSGGIKVHAEEVEAAISKVADVSAVAVVGMPDPVWGERIEAHVVPASDTVTAQTIADAIAAQDLLPRAMRPKVIHLCKSLPTGPTGKLYRKALRAGQPLAEARNEEMKG